LPFTDAVGDCCDRAVQLYATEAADEQIEQEDGDGRAPHLKRCTWPLASLLLCAGACSDEDTGNSATTAGGTAASGGDFSVRYVDAFPGLP
jgi:hypothetical protein